MTYIGLGRKKATAAADLTGLNTGNLTNVFDHGILAANVARFELYHIAVTNLSQVATVTVYVGADVYSSVPLVGNAEWDPSQPLLLTPDDDVYLCWDLAESVTPAPVATVWLRFDPAAQPADVTA